MILSSIPFSSRMRITPMARASTMVSGHDRLLADHQRVERVAVVAEGARDEAVVGGIVDGAVSTRSSLQQPGFLVELVLVLAPHRDFDDDRERLLDEVVVHVDVVPRVHHRAPGCGAAVRHPVILVPPRDGRRPGRRAGLPVPSSPPLPALLLALPLIAAAPARARQAAAAPAGGDLKAISRTSRR